MRALFVLALVGAVAAVGQKPEKLITVAEIRAQMYFLASDDMAGRDAGSLGGRIAANYIASEYARLGLKPVGDRESYFQNLELVRYDLEAAGMGLSAQVNGVAKTFEYRKDFNWARQSGKNASRTAWMSAACRSWGSRRQAVFGWNPPHDEPCRIIPSGTLVGPSCL